MVIVVNEGSSIDDVVWTEDVLNEADKLCKEGNCTADDLEIMV
jgi:hypothetical protein